MFASVFGNLHHDLAEFAKELSSGVPLKSTAKPTAEGDGDAGAAAKVESLGTGAVVREGENGATQSEQQPHEGGKTFLLDWASSSDEDDAEDDVASEWEQVTRLSTAADAAKKQAGGPVPSALAKDFSGQRQTALRPEAASGGGAASEALKSRARPEARALPAPTIAAASGGSGEEDKEEAQRLREALRALQSEREKDRQDLAAARALIARLQAELAARDEDIRRLRAQAAVAAAAPASDGTAGGYGGGGDADDDDDQQDCARR